MVVYSLTATFLRIRIVAAMKRCGPATSAKAQNVDPSVVFSYPTVASLAAHLASLVSTSVNPTDDDSVNHHLQEMNLMIQRYTADLPKIRIAPGASRPAKETVVITGTTGSLGSLMLARAIVDDRVEKVWAINRAGNGGQTVAERQRASFLEKSLDSSLLENSKVRFVEAQLNVYSLGLDPSLYNEVRGAQNFTPVTSSLIAGPRSSILQRS